MDRYRWLPFWFGVAVAVTGMVVLAAVILTEPAASDTGEACTWGASSTEATLVDGRWVVAEPETSGCLP